MSKCQALRALVNERLALAAEEIFSLFEKTIAEYEEELCRSNEENHRKHQHLENLCPRVKLFRAEVHIPSSNPSDNNLNQEITEIIQTKKEPEEPSVKQEEDLQPETLHELSDFHVKIEESLLLQQRQIDHREETRGEDICSKLHNTEHSSDIDEDWESSFSYLDVQMDSCMVAQNSDPPLKFDSAPLKTSAAVNNGAMSEKNERTERKYQCSICEKRFKTKQHLQVHTRVHTGEKPYRCLVCEKTFAHKGSLVIHRRIHTGEKPFSCLLCNSSSGHKGYLQNHMRIHTGEKPYTCVVCGKSFSQKTNLEVHKRTHTGEKPYSCPICNSTFSKKTHRDTHMRTFHTVE